jgi:hypothetical protein
LLLNPLQLDVIETINPTFYLRADLRKINLGDFLQIGKTYNPGTGLVDGDAKFLIDYATANFKLLVDIQAAIAIPMLKTFATVNITVNSEGAHLQGEISFLGGLLNPTALIKWDWGFEHFYAEFGDISFSPALVMDKLILDIDTTGDFTLYFSMDVTVLAFASIGADLWIEERNDGQNLFVKFEATADFALVETTVKGSALLDLYDIKQTQFGGFSMTLKPGGAAKAVAEWVGNAAKAVADGINKAIEKVGIAIQEIGAAINNVLDKLDFIAEAWDNFASGIASLLSGDPGAFASAMVDSFNTLLIQKRGKTSGMRFWMVLKTSAMPSPIFLLHP